MIDLNVWHRSIVAFCTSRLAALTLLILAAVPAQAETAGTSFEERVRAYILANPEVILEALEILSQREERAAQTVKISKYEGLFSEPPVLGIGPKDAKITVIEFFDYRCAPCKALHPKLTAALEAHPDIRVEMRHLPILSPGSERGARFALAVKNIAGSTAYAAVHEDLWHLKGPLRTEAFEKIADDHGLDWEAVAAEMDSDVVTSRIAENRDIAVDLEILGTPAFVTPTSVSFGGSSPQVLINAWISQ